MARFVIKDKGRGVTEIDRQEINLAIEDAISLSLKVNQDMEEIWNQGGGPIKRRRRRRRAWDNNKKFCKWLGPCTRPMMLIRRVRRRMLTILHWLRNGRLVFIAHGTDKRYCKNNPMTWAFVGVPRRSVTRIGLPPINALRIHLCPPWFDRGMSEGERRSRATCSNP